MKIASTSTNSTPSETALPSLLSCGPSKARSSSDAVPTSAETRNADPVQTDPTQADPTQAGQSVTTFDAILAMFNVPQTVPQNLPQPLQPIVAATSGSPVSAAAVTLDAQNNVTTQTPLSDVALPRSLQVVVPVDAPTIASTTTPLPLNVVNTSAIPPTTSTSVDSTIVSPTVSDVVSQAAKVESSMLSAAETKLAAPQSGSEPRPQRTVSTVAATSEDSSSEAIVATRVESPALSGVLTTGSNTLPMRDLSEISRRLLPARDETSNETHLRQQHSSTESQIAADLVASTTQPSELVDHGVRQLDVSHLAEQVSAAMQTHGSEVAAGQPVEVHLRLDPPELGMVRVHLRMSDDVVSVRFIAGDEAVTKLLESQLPDLRQSLAERGLAFAQCHVSCDSRQQQQSSNSSQDPDLPSFASKPIATRSWSRAAFVTRSLNTRSDRVDILA